MYCYNCKSSDEEQIKTVSTTSTSETPTSNYAKIGNGYAKITKSIESVASSVKVITNEPEALDSTNKTTVENGTIIFYMDENSKLISGSRCTYKVEDNKIALRRFGTEVDRIGALGRGAHLGREHQVELTHLGPVART